jgi:deoxycytidine triphosphate deaminase
VILGTESIIHGLNVGAIVCDPPPARIEGAHIDVTLGEYYWIVDLGDAWSSEEEIVTLDTADPRQYATLHKAAPLDWAETEFPEGPCCVVIPAHGFVLAHTAEYIGVGAGSGLVPNLHTRSTLARWFLAVCTANAGMGDPAAPDSPGYCTRWTLEIENPHSVDIAIPVGARIGAISFARVEGAATPYAPGTRYNATRREWTPDAMLPRKGNW